MIEVTSLIATAVLVGLTLFQLALILGAPIGRFAWGGQHDVLPTRLRVGSIVSILLYAIFAIFILGRASILSMPFSADVLRVGMWVFTVYFFVGIFMNGVSRSKPEKLLMTPVAAALAILFLVVALS